MGARALIKMGARRALLKNGCSTSPLKKLKNFFIHQNNGIYTQNCEFDSGIAVGLSIFEGIT